MNHLSILARTRRALPPAAAFVLLTGLAGCNSLQKAAQSGDVQAVVKGLTAGKDVNMVDQHGRPLISIAAERGQLGVIRELVARQADLEKKDSRGMTPLYIAAGFNQLAAVQELVAAGAAVDSRNAELEMTPLLPAAESGYKAVVEYLLDKGATPDARSRDGQTALSRLARTNAKSSQSDNLGTAQLLLARVRATAGAKGATAYVNLADSSGFTPLHRAAGSNNAGMIAWLLKAGASPNPTATLADADPVGAITPEVSPFAESLQVSSGLSALLPRRAGAATTAADAPAAVDTATVAAPPAALARWTPLHSLALHCGAGEAAMKALLDGGANPLARAGDERSALQLLADCEAGDPALVVKLLLDKAKAKAPAAEFRKFLAEQGKTSGSSALIRAVSRGHAETARLLLAAGASPNAVGEDGKVALQIALAAGNTVILKHLLAAKADPNLADANGTLPLFMMVEKGDAAAVQLLLEAGARPNVVVTGGWTPLYKAVVNNHLEIVKALLAAKANPNYAPTGGPAALHVALGQDQPVIVAALLGAGADANLPRPDGQPALHWAVRNGKDVMAQLLITHRAELNRKHNKATPLYWSVVDNRPVLTKLLLDAGADPNATYEGEEWTPLHKAAHDGKAQAMQMLIAAGANRSLRNNAGKTPDDLAREREQRLAAEAAAARQREQEKQQNSFQWGKFAAMAVGAAAGGLGELDSGAQTDLMLGMVKDSMAGQQGMSNSQAAAQRLSSGAGSYGGSGSSAQPMTDLNNALASRGGMASSGSSAGSVTEGSYMMEGGGYTLELRRDGNSLIGVEPAYNKTSVYQPAGNGSYVTVSEKLGTRFYLRPIGAQAIEVWKEGNTPSRMNLMSSRSAGAGAGSGDSNSMAVAERYRALSQSDPDNAQTWTACSAAALKRAHATGAEADAYGRQMASMLRQIMVNPGATPCGDAIPASLW